ncbi:hypothetical protein WHU67_24085 (plasmid) [Escherichia coli]|jgi:type II secretory pathway pseudopilin PulG|uniref:Truncated BfpA n=1 Tax=Escherichia coli TaxID=562 RepID=Q9WTA5_ECOLX|nr:BfpA protein [Escherichia coli]AAD30026.1 truncated BfpA [Escherichia coli]
MVSKIMNKKYEKGLSLIESAMVLALAATVTAGVMFYYQSASDSNKAQNAISEVMSATSAINGLYIGQTSYNGLNSNILLNTSAIPDNCKRAARTVLTGMCYSVGSATRQGSSSPTRFIGQSAMTSRT